MANTDTRRMAADARRIAARKSEEEATATLRETLKKNYERGREAGREEMRAELQGVDSRRALLDSAADHCESTGSRISSIPNSNAELRACREAEGILRDAAKSSEVAAEDPEPAPEPPPKKSTRKKT